MKALSLNNVSVYYNSSKLPAISGINFSINEGQIVTIIGPNGSGKTTLIKAILSFLPFTGEIKIFDRPQNEMLKKIGYVPQRFSFDTSLPITVKEAMQMSLNAHRVKSEVDIAGIINLFGITPYLNKKLGEVSGGQLQRVLLARSLVTNPSILILDEPEVGIDIGGETTLFRLLKKLVEEKNITVLIASHELDVVFQFSNQVICINKQLICSGKPQEVINNDTLYKLYGMDISLYHHHHKSLH